MKLKDQLLKPHVFHMIGVKPCDNWFRGMLVAGGQCGFE